mgnify:CR=1 FL=1
MQVGKTYTIKLRISKEKNKIQLIDGDGIPIADANVDSKITIASLRVEPIMSSKLISDSSKMSIQPVSTFIQDIEKEGWKFKGKSIDVWFEKEGIFEMHNFTVYKIVMHYNLNDHWMFIYAEDRGSEYELFKGIISSINEFRKICKWLNIK